MRNVRIHRSGNIAFVGLSQVRESAVFSGSPIIERVTERRADLRGLHDQPHIPADGKRQHAEKLHHPAGSSKLQKA